MFSIICVYSKRETFQRYLLRSIERQSVEYEPVFIDNCNHQFLSAASALNNGGRKAVGKYIMFVHQDVDFESPSWLADAEKMLDALPDLGVAGVAGISETGRNLCERGRNIIFHGAERIPWEFGNPITEPEAVQTLDCCALIVPHNVFERYQFDEVNCNGWHLYGEDYCLQVQLAGLKAYALPLSVYHASRGATKSNRAKIVLSLGALPPEYYSTLNALIAKYRGKYRYIYTTNGEWNTFQPVLIQRAGILARSAIELCRRKPRGK